MLLPLQYYFYNSMNIMTNIVSGIVALLSVAVSVSVGLEESWKQDACRYNSMVWVNNFVRESVCSLIQLLQESYANLFQTSRKNELSFVLFNDTWSK